MSTWNDEMHAEAREATGLYYPSALHKAFLIHALDKIERLRAEPVQITDDMVERAAIQMCATDRQGSVWAILSTEEKDDFRADARAALEAAHHHEGEPTAAGDSVVPETTERGEQVQLFAQRLWTAAAEVAGDEVPPLEELDELEVEGLRSVTESVLSAMAVLLSRRHAAVPRPAGSEGEVP